MPYDVRMPDGTIISNVPEGTKRADLEQRYKASKARQAGAKHPILGPILSAVSGISDQLTFGAGDEVSATLDTLLPGTGPNMWNTSFGKAWRQNQQSRQAQNDMLARTSPNASLAGSVAGAVLPALLTGGASSPMSLGKSTALAAGQGALYGFNSGKGGVVNRAKQIPVGLAYGAGGNLAGRALGKLASRAIGGTTSKNVRILNDEGITMTPGQRSGKRSIRNVFEDKVLGSIPFVSDIPEAARNRGVNDLRVAVANRVMAPIGESVPAGTPINTDAMGGIQSRVYDAFDDAAGNLSLAPDADLALDFAQTAASSPRLLGTEGAQQVQANIDFLNDRMGYNPNQIGPPVPITGDTLRETLGELRGLASTSPGQMGQQFWALHDNIVDAMGRQNAPEALTAFNNAREATALLKRMEAASAAPGVTNGEFGPTQLLQSVKKRGYGTTTGNIANGEARMLDLANAAADVMRNTTANSGTTPRAIAAGLGLGGGAGGLGALGLVSPVSAAAIAAPLIGYAPGIDKILQKLALTRPDIFRRAGDAIDRNNPTLGMAGVGGALGLYSQTP